MNQVSASWSTEQIELHREAACRLCVIKDATFAFLQGNPGVSERQAQAFVVERYKASGLTIDKHLPIVAFNQSSAEPHYDALLQPKSLTPQTIVMLDIWAALKVQSAPYADITWMAYYGSDIPPEVDSAYHAVILARDSAICYLQTELARARMPTGREVHGVTNSVMIKAGFENNIVHSTGHSIGFTSPHGRYRHVGKRNHYPLVRNLGYTIEPGLYFPGQFGIRSEIDFYISSSGEVLVTTEQQHDLTFI
jgi:Xaa-Pro dipeptidase